MIKLALASLLFAFTSGCAVFPIGVGSAIAERDLGGDWHSDGGGVLRIGCSGSIDSGLGSTNPAAPPGGGSSMPGNSGEMSSQAHISAVDAQGFTVSHWPSSSERYTVTQWPDRAGAGAIMIAGGVRWRRVDEGCRRANR